MRRAWARPCGSRSASRPGSAEVDRASTRRHRAPFVFAMSSLALTGGGALVLEEPSMSIDRSLRVQSASLKGRSVLTRMERIAKLEHARKWKEGDAVMGLPKV